MQRIHQLIWYLTIFFVPLSVPKEIGGGFYVSFPAEILIVLCFLLGFFTSSSVPQNFSFLRNPITWAIIADFLMMILTTLCSVQPEISFKKLIIRMLMLGVFYMQAIHRFQLEKEIIRFWYCYVAGMMFAVIYILIQHGQYQFLTTVAPEITQPLFAEHAVYGGCLAFLLPFLAIRWLKWDLFGQRKWIWAALFCLFLFAQYAAASRAAWIGAFAAMFLFSVLIFRIKWWQIGIVVSILAVFVGINQEGISLYIRQNKAESHNLNANIVEHFSSITNLQTDVSNLERLNRWGAALRMIEERPFLGFGPGTYQFNYGRYQVFSELTRISTRSGNRGNAHSEYLMAWVETGLGGFCTFLFMFGLAMYSGIKKIDSLQEQKAKYLQIAALLGLFSYLVHGVVNSFLDQDEAATLVWATMAMVASKQGRDFVKLSNFDKVPSP